MRNEPILSSDSDAVEQLQKKLATLIAERDKMKAVNNAWRKCEKGDTSALIALGYTPESIQALAARIATAYSWEKQPYVGWQLTNLGATIRSVQKRIDHLGKVQAEPEQTVKGANGIDYEDSPKDNRVRLFFPSKPDDLTRTKLKSFGFRWTPTLGCWQAYRNYRAETYARSLIAEPVTDHGAQTEANNALMLKMDAEREARRTAQPTLVTPDNVNMVFPVQPEEGA